MTQRAWQFKLKLPEKTIKTFVYSDTGTDIETRFPGYKVTNVKEIKDPLTDMSYDGWGQKAKDKKKQEQETKDKEKPEQEKAIKEDGTPVDEITLEDLNEEVQELFKRKQ
jgi:hypothetical protein|tara:strand:+ start:1683 stop:2012 length:330 start_codon:yes stop_codon:yes gene_type:complete